MRAIALASPRSSKRLTSLSSMSLVLNGECWAGVEYNALVASLLLAHVQSVCVNSRCVRIYCTTRRKSLLAECIETFHRIRTQWHIHTHTLRHIHLEHTRFNYKRDDLVLPFSGSFSQNAAHSRIAGPHSMRPIDDDEIFTHKEMVYYYYCDDYDSHMLPPPSSPNGWIMTKVLPRNTGWLSSVRAQRRSRTEEKTRLRHSRHTIHLNFFFSLLYFVSFWSGGDFFRPTRLHAKEERTFVRTYVCRWQHISFAVHRFRSYMRRLLILSFFFVVASSTRLDSLVL